MKFTRAKGAFDIYPEDSWKSSLHWQYVESEYRKVAFTYGYNEIRTPIFEKTDLFVRCVGEASDIVSKEMYTFEDKGSRSLTLRPEGTAPVLRAYIENQLQQNKKAQKLFYMGPYFRYDRPQAGRYRQFHQFGAEAIGINDPMQDVEIIDLLCEFYRRLGLKDLTVLINSIGDFSTREKYSAALREFLRSSYHQLSEDSQKRFEKNPMRILDSKDKQDQLLLEHAPSISQFLDEQSKEKFNFITNQLNRLGITYKIDPRLVRGLDYYNEMVFEITSDVLGAQSTIGAGGRYDPLLKMLGGPDLPAVGFATGIERLLITLEGQKLLPMQKDHITCYFIPMNEHAKTISFDICKKLRGKNIRCEVNLQSKKMQKAMQQANGLDAQFVVIIGEEEIAGQEVTVKDMHNGEQQRLSLDRFLNEYTKKMEN